MGDIVHLPAGDATLEVDIRTNSPIERVDIFCGEHLVETVRPYGEADLGPRIRVEWEGAEYRGRFRQVVWDGTARFDGNRVVEATPVNFLNRDKTLDRYGADGLSWKALTTGNYGGFDAVLEHGESGTLRLDTPLVQVELPVAEIGLEDRIFDASGELPRFVKVFRLPRRNTIRALGFTRTVPVAETGDTPIYIRLTQEDGTRA